MFNGELVGHVLNSEKLRLNRIIMAFASGSYQHGARIEGKSDLYVAGVFIGTPAQELTIGNEDPKKDGHVTITTSTDSQKNKVGDVDLKVYSLRRWAGLALKGNPTILSYLFVPDAIKDSFVTHPSVWDKYILPNKHLFLASGHASAFLGLAKSQYERINGLSGSGKHGQRDELINEHGYDSKAGMHLVRSLDECLEFLKTGSMTFPRPNVDVLLDIRAGNWSLDKLNEAYFQLRADVVAAEEASPLQPECDRKAVTKLVADAMMEHWDTDNKKWMKESQRCTPLSIYRAALKSANEDVKYHTEKLAQSAKQLAQQNQFLKDLRESLAK